MLEVCVGRRLGVVVFGFEGLWKVKPDALSSFTRRCCSVVIFLWASGLGTAAPANGFDCELC